MKTCPYCGAKYSDELEKCPVDQTALETIGGLKPTVEAVVPQFAFSPREQQFWERMTFRQFAILIVRLQALWLFFNAVLDVTYVPNYITFHSSAYRSSLLIASGLYTLLLRILLNIVAGVLVIQKTEKLLSWMVKDCVSEQPEPKK
jgi:hypothetical protein